MNVIYDQAGNATYNGTAGNDWFVSAGGNDTMNGGAGSDTYDGSANTNGFLASYPKTSHSVSCVVVGQQDGGMERDYWYSAARDPGPWP